MSAAVADGEALAERVVTVGARAIVTFEPTNLDALLDSRAATNGVAPYGAVAWPAGIAIARALLDEDLAGHALVDVGAGTGLVSIAAALAGARVHALDIDPLSEVLIARAASRAGVTVRFSRFDLLTRDALPPADVVVVADVLYEPVLAGAVARRVSEALARGSRVIVGDPGRAGRAAFISLLTELGRAPVFVDAVVEHDAARHVVGVWDARP